MHQLADSSVFWVLAITALVVLYLPPRCAIRGAHMSVSARRADDTRFWLARGSTRVSALREASPLPANDRGRYLGGS